MIVIEHQSIRKKSDALHLGYLDDIRNSIMFPKLAEWLRPNLHGDGLEVRRCRVQLNQRATLENDPFLLM